ncbi:MAG: hypothetical protein AB7G93_11745 [Bdellovibrionales bacterium]
MREIYDLGKGRSVRQKTVSVDNVIPDKSIQERHLSDELLQFVAAAGKSIKFDGILGSVADVASGAADFSNPQVAHDTLPEGSSILVLRNTFTGPAGGSEVFLNKTEVSNSDAGLDGNSNLFGTLFPSHANQIRILNSIDVEIRNNGIVSTTAQTLLTLWETSANLPTVKLADSNSFLPAQLPVATGIRHTFTFPPTILYPNRTYAFAFDFVLNFGGGNVIVGRRTPATLIPGIGTVNSVNNGFSWTSGGNLEFTNYNLNTSTVGGYVFTKRFNWVGLGFDSKFNTAITLGGNRSRLENLRYGGQVYIVGNQNFLTGWHASGLSPIDQGIDTAAIVAEES